MRHQAQRYGSVLLISSSASSARGRILMITVEMFCGVRKFLTLPQNILHRIPEPYEVITSSNKHSSVGLVGFRPDKFINGRRKNISFAFIVIFLS